MDIKLKNKLPKPVKVILIYVIGVLLCFALYYFIDEILNGSFVNWFEENYMIEEAFVDMMNEKATEIGMSNTHFCNATGLHNPDHYSTVKDISILLKYALQYEDFRQAFSSSRYSTRPTNQHPDGFTFRSTMFKYMDSTEVVGGEIIGGKTGYTEEAGLCLASLAEVDGKEYILVTAKANGTHQTEQFHILDAINVYSQIGELNITN